MSKFAVIKDSLAGYAFTKFHETLEEAQTEAHRLAKKEGKRFFVLKVVGFVRQAEFPTIWCDAENVLMQEDPICY